MASGTSSPDGRLRELARPGWRLVQEGEHPLGALQGRPLGKGRLLVLLGPKNPVGASYFQLFLQRSGGRFSQQPTLGGSSQLRPAGHGSGPWGCLQRLLPWAALCSRLASGGGFKGWYFAEGGNEGPRKLQAFKALNQEQARQVEDDTIRRLVSFLERPPTGSRPRLVQLYRRLVQDILQGLRAPG